MFSTQTLFILGAGASVPYGYPLGKDLIKCILEDMKDQILIPYYRKNEGPPYWNKNDLENGYFYEYEYIKDILIHIKDKVGQINVENLLTTGTDYLNINDCFHTNDTINRYQCVNINKIDIFNKLELALRSFSTISIDTFLRDNPSHRVAGKTMIIYSLLKRECLNNFSDPDNDNWYAFLFNDLVSECAENPINLLKNKIDFLTFNYDVSLDYYLETRIRHTELFSLLADEFLTSLSIDHVYGKIYNKGAVYGSFSDVHDSKLKNFNLGFIWPGSSSENLSQTYKPLSKKTFQNFKRFIFGINNFAQIKTMFDEREHKKFTDIILQNQKKITRAEKIIFIGFGFDRENLKILGIPNSLEDFIKIFPGKTIQFLNYRGKAKSLELEFQRLRNECKKGELLTNIITSSADSITDAYNDDFRNYLF